MILPKTNEWPIRTQYGRWLWCHDHEDGWEGYLHLDCDMVCDDNGRCIGCGSPSPAAIPTPLCCSACGERPCSCFTNAARLRRGEV